MKTLSYKSITILILLCGLSTNLTVFAKNSLQRDVYQSTFVGNGVLKGVGGGIVDNGAIYYGTEVGNGVVLFASSGGVIVGNGVIYRHWGVGNGVILHAGGQEVGNGFILQAVGDEVGNGVVAIADSNLVTVSFLLA